MRRIKADSNRLRANHKRYPTEKIIKIDGENAKCKYCGRTPLVSGFDFMRTRDEIEETACYECHEAGRTSETSRDALMSLGFAMSGLKIRTFPQAPEPGTPREGVAGLCNVCGKAVLYDRYTDKLIDGYHEILRNIWVHNKCDEKRNQ